MTRDRKRPARGEVPSKADILRFVGDSSAKVTKREIARAFGLKGKSRVALKERLREMIDEGTLVRDAAKSLRPAGRLPRVTVVEAIGPDAFGDMLLRPVNWEADTPPPKIYLVAPARRGARTPALGVGDRALVRLAEETEEGIYAATVLKVLEGAPRRVLGVFHGGPGGGRVVPVAKGARQELLIEAGDEKGARDGELVLAELLPRGRGRVHGLKPARVLERHGDVSAPHRISLIAIHEHGLPTDFSPAALAEARAAKPPPLGAREDLRDLPLITIDPADARDHDDAVFAAPDPDPKNPGGWHLIVAIADVAHFVRPGSALDREARERGNSAYFPDRVVPMLPEALSTDLCSLMPGQDRPVLAAHIWIDAEGAVRRHRFTRAMIRSAANIAYEVVEAAMGGTPTPEAAPLVEPVLRPLFGAHAALARARARRGPLEIRSEERQIILDDSGHVADIRPRPQLHAHRVIEDFMISANVAAAETLERRTTPCMYRDHEPPPPDRVESLREFLASLDFRMPRASAVTPKLFNRILAHFAGTPHADLVNEVVLRTQSQAYYAPVNHGHFGLALPRYAHFTSPIRRYADILVHRGLIRALGLGKDGLGDDEAAAMEETGAHISATERRAMAAERDSVDRYLARYLAGHVGETFEGRISGVTRFGLFVTLLPSGGDGLVPLSSMAGDFYHFDAERHRLVGRRHGRVYRLGDTVTVRLVAAEPISGGLRLALVGEDAPARDAERRPPAGGQRRHRRPGKGKR